MILKVGVQNFLDRHEAALSKSSLLAKVFVVLLAIPVFLLTTIFKIGVGVSNMLSNEANAGMTIFVGLGLPNLVILFFKVCICICI